MVSSVTFLKIVDSADDNGTSWNNNDFAVYNNISGVSERSLTLKFRKLVIHIWVIQAIMFFPFACSFFVYLLANSKTSRFFTSLAKGDFAGGVRDGERKIRLNFGGNLDLRWVNDQKPQ